MANLEGLNWYGQWTLEDQVLYNMVTFFHYGLLEVGAYRNIQKDQLDFAGRNESILAPVSFYASGLPNYQVYRGLKYDWVWETGITAKYTGGSPPIQMSGIFVNNTFYSTGTAISGTGFNFDYSRGQVIFSQPINSGWVVKAPNTIRMAHVYLEESSEYRRLTTDWMDATGGSGTYDSSLKIYLPAIFIGIDSVRTRRGVELGNRSKFANIKLRFDVMGLNPYETKKLADIVYNLEEKNLQFFDLNRVPFPLNTSGNLLPGAQTYPSLVANYPWGVAAHFAQNAYISKIRSTLPIFHRRVTIDVELITTPV